MGVAKKISQVMEKVQYLKKDGRVKYGRTNYRFLSEEKITTNIRKAFEEVGLIAYPIEMKITDSQEIKTKSGSKYLEKISVIYRIQDAEDDSYIDVQALGEGMDGGDKKINKAMTAAYKYMQRQTFMIPTGDDPDHISTNELLDGDEENNKEKVEDDTITEQTKKEIDELISKAKEKAGGNYTEHQVKSQAYKDFAKEKGWKKFFISDNTKENMAKQFLKYLEGRLG